VFIGNIPPVLDRVNKNKQSNISSISCSRIEKPINKDCDWFGFDIPLNPSMVAIIGNKGSGKSAFSDIIGHLCRCNTMGSASFLNDKRFRKSPKNYANDYTATLTWLDEEVCTNTLTVNSDDSSIEDAQYLPQKYIEELRLRQAKFLLISTTYSLAEISYSCGFSSQAYFSLVFKNTTGQTPNAFRKIALAAYKI